MNDSFIRDNYSRGTVGDFLQQAITENSEVSIVSAYFTIHAYTQLKAAFDGIKKLRFLFGEPTFIKPRDIDAANPREYKFEDDALYIPLANQLSLGARAKNCADWIKEKVEIRSMVKPNFLHGKMYYIAQESGIQKAIAGSSNFTVHGLGLGKRKDKNIELNIVIDSDRNRKELKEWFDSIWNDKTGLVEDVKEKVLTYLAQLYSENSPEFIYYKTLYHLFGDYLAEQKDDRFLGEKKSLYESEIWNTLYDFQKDGVKGAINKILKYKGCIIADSVGLGKTYEALAIIKYFEFQNARVLIICPKKLSANWTVYQASQGQNINPFKKDRFGYTVLYHTDMGRTSGKSDANAVDLANFDWGGYDLVVIDESHNFRGNPETKEKGGATKMNRTMWLLEKIIKSGYQTKVLMLSATPVNNTLRDLRNQISFITGGKEDALFDSCGIKNYSEILKNAQANFTRWSDPQNKDQRTKELLQRLDAAFFKLLDELTIARSRRHITSYYNMDAIGSFPLREKPLAIYPDIDSANRFPSYDFINKQIQTYQLSIFNPTKYVMADKKNKYELSVEGKEQFTQSAREFFLIGMMRVNFLKRLESSIESFKITLERTITKIENLQKKIQSFKSKEITPDEMLDDMMPSDEELNSETWEREDADAWFVGKKLQFNLADMELDEWTKDLQADKDALVNLFNNATAVTPDRDAKLAELKHIIKEKVKNPFNLGNKKVIVFTAFSDTADYLYRNLQTWIQNELCLETALVYGSGSQTTYGKNDFDHILINFSPRSKRRAELSIDSENMKDTGKEIDILIATDCISEGQNLQDCDLLINYDIHWNPVRIIQRFGRIDRIGSVNKSIRLVNFWPTKDLDSYINLKARVEARMALVDISATADDNILKTDQMEDLITDDLKYRDQQLKRLQNEILDLEDMDETISLTDFTLDDFRIELLNYITYNKERLKNTPFGLYAVTSCSNDNDIIRPGVIYCLAQKKVDSENDKINPLNPYFLVYIRDDGTVRYTYIHSKHILEMFRQLCKDKKVPQEFLCSLFHKGTQNGTDMSKYADLVKKAAEETVRVFKRKEGAALTTDRGSLLIPDEKKVSAMEDFELVTWLVIKEDVNGNN